MNLTGASARIIAISLASGYLLSACSPAARGSGAWSFRSKAVVLCDQKSMTLTWNKNTEPPPVSDLTTAARIIGEEVRYMMQLTPHCSGKVSVYAHDHGWRNKKETCGGVYFPGTSEICAEFPTGASLRVNVDGKELCRVNDGKAPPPAPGTWYHPDSNFDTFNLVCARQPGSRPYEYSIEAGQTITFEAYRWNVNAETAPGDGFRFQVIFARTP